MGRKRKRDAASLTSDQKDSTSSPSVNEKTVRNTRRRFGKKELTQEKIKNRGRAGRVLNGLVFSITGVSASRRKELKEDLETAGASFSNVLHDRVDYLIGTELAIKKNTQRIRKAVKKGIPIVKEEFLSKCIQAGQTVPADDSLTLQPKIKKSK